MKIYLEERLGKNDLTIYDLKQFYSDLYHLGLQYKQKQLIKKGAF